MSTLSRVHRESKGVGLEESRDEVAEHDDGDKPDSDRFRFKFIVQLEMDEFK